MLMVELKKKEPRTVQRTIRVPKYLLRWLEQESKAVEISVPQAIVQIVEQAYLQSRKAGQK